MNEPTDEALRLEDLPEMLTPQQVADYLQVRRSMIYELCAQRRIPSHKLSFKVLRIPKAGLLQAIEDGGIFTGPYGLGVKAAEVAARNGGRKQR